MNKKTKKIILGVSSFILVGAAIIGGGVFAKYITSETRSETMEVAKWDTSIDSIIVTKTTYNAEALAQDKIAPGTEGAINVEFSIGDNETGVDYKVDICDVVNKPTNLYFLVDGEKFTSLDEVTTLLTGHVNPGEGNKTISKQIQWKWDYQTGTIPNVIQANDVIDTNDGKLAQDMSFDIVVSATQTRPQ